MASLGLYGGIGFRNSGANYSGKTPQPIVIPDDQATGGWLFLNLYEAELQRRKREEEEREEILEQIEDSVDREIAAILLPQMARDDELQRLKELAQREADLTAAQAYSDRVSKAYLRAVSKGNYSALEALDRELQRAREEEEFLMLAIAAVLDD